ncbi:FIG00469551: hypothetical protein [hydrothermal vent metagenome]|uniref:DUF3972 domain-containing protein n=1 Tax=hydrothermal vent metagenome TaxID=652676 RepID=A0A1W1D399_9ZZZZ
MDWMSEEEYGKLMGLNLSAIEDLIAQNKLSTKIENGIRYIDASKKIENVVPTQLKSLSNQNEMALQPQFIEKTIGTIISLHEKVLDAKDEALEAVRSENKLLREALESLQELYDEDRKTITTLQQQLKLSQEEVEFMRRKYKLMWNKTIEEHI